MKNILPLILFFNWIILQAQITQTIVHETGGNSVAYQLSSLDSIVYDSQNINMIIHEAGGITVNYPIANVDSLTFDTTAVFSCPATLTDSRDAQTYPVIQIGNQCWMAENLRYNASGSWLNSANPSTTYGRLYNWVTAMTNASSSTSNPSGIQGVCPSGWHLPSDPEWNEMEMALGMSAADTALTGWRGTHGSDMKSTTDWNSGGAGTNTSGFNAFPSGVYYSGSYFTLGTSAYFWSTTESSPNNAMARHLNSANTEVTRDNYVKSYGFPCRCVKD